MWSFIIFAMILTLMSGPCRSQDEQLTLEECFDKYDRGIYPHPDDCTKFLSCASTEPLDCPAGLHFNPTEFVCDWAANAGCMKVTTPIPSDSPESQTDDINKNTPNLSDTSESPEVTSSPSNNRVPETDKSSEAPGTSPKSTDTQKSGSPTDSPQTTKNPLDKPNENPVTNPKLSTSQGNEETTSPEINKSPETTTKPEETTPKDSSTSGSDKPSETATKPSSPLESNKPTEPVETTPKESEQTTPKNASSPESVKPSQTTSNPTETTPKDSSSSGSDKPSETTTKPSSPSESDKPTQSVETTPKESEQTTPKDSTPPGTDKPSESTTKPLNPLESDKPTGPTEITPKESEHTTPKDSSSPDTNKPAETTTKPSNPSESDKQTQPVETTPKESEQTTPKDSTPPGSVKPEITTRPTAAVETTPKNSEQTTPKDSSSPGSDKPSESTTKPLNPLESDKPTGPTEITPKESEHTTPKDSSSPDTNKPAETTTKPSNPSESDKPTQPVETTPKESEQTTPKDSTPPGSVKPSETTVKSTKAAGEPFEIETTPMEPSNVFQLSSEPPNLISESTPELDSVKPNVPTETECDIENAKQGSCQSPKEIDSPAVDLGSRFKETTSYPDTDRREPLTESPELPDTLNWQACLHQHKFGIFAHPSDPTKFYICTKSTPREMTCPQGLEFDSASYGCDRPKTPTSAPPPMLNLQECLFQHKNGLFSHPTDCTKFYACSKRGPIEMFCPGGLHFNPMKLVCDWPSRHCISPEARTRDQIFRAMKADKITPDLVDRCPEKLAEVAFPSGGQVNLGKELTPSQTLQPPSIYWQADQQSFYTLCMVDPDGPRTTDSKPNIWNHWTVGNIPGNKISQGQPLVEYLPPCPQQNTPLHRYTYMIYKQPRRINFSEPKIPATSYQNREGFSMRRFAEKYQLGQPIAGNYFKCRYDRSVPNILERIGYKPNLSMVRPGHRSYSYSFSFRG
ncbi:hypothetical protein ABEB36_007126 [Hypothenemus hampei]|uniref:Chitin-binding type-2 domain-containing protein n=1 Tax=Hypothenemus hampei TaxID=57062 RepID=A0ABD1ESZ6_HYPHA